MRANGALAGHGTNNLASPNDPFKVLMDASASLVQQLRRDELVPELGKQLSNSSPPPAYGYFCDPFVPGSLGSQVEREGFVQLPPHLARERDRVECMSFMGLLPEIHHAWLSVDNVLYLWDYQTQDFTQYRDLDQVIVTVALVPPKRGVFQDAVKYILVVATTIEVVLLAVTLKDRKNVGGGRGKGANAAGEAWEELEGRVEVRPTNFKAGTDGVSMLKIVGHPNGRVFMAGKDGNLYELEYRVTYGFMYSVFFVGDSTGTRKCRRLARTSNSSPSSVVPALLTLLGLRSGDRVLVDIVVDSMRNIVYTLDCDGGIDLFDLGLDGNQTIQKASHFNLWQAAQRTCARVSGWETRTHLLPDQRVFDKPHPYQVVSLQVVDPLESQEIHLVAVSNAGMRFYLSSGYSGGNQRAGLLSVNHIRSPPPESLWHYLRGSSDPSTPGGPSHALPGGVISSAGGGGRRRPPPEGFPPKIGRSSTSPAVYDAYCCHGLTVMAESGGEHGEGDRLILIGQDFTTRQAYKRETRTEELPSMREAVSEIGGRGAISGNGNGAIGRIEGEAGINRSTSQSLALVVGG
ncbi:unnamed protein product, partial [Choristocarpus tenellus]